MDPYKVLLVTLLPTAPAPRLAPVSSMAPQCSQDKVQTLSMAFETLFVRTSVENPTNPFLDPIYPTTSPQALPYIHSFVYSLLRRCCIQAVCPNHTYSSLLTHHTLS